ncbi:MAG: glutamate racemase [Desulfovibrio sp.]|nr:glutamate racemase [Desulfovibrio sp.]
MQNSEKPIGIFDSGVGGLTVFKAISELLPNENLLYLGDTARVPYGTRSRETIRKYTEMAAARLTDYNIKMLVIACNTATSASLPGLESRFPDLLVAGVIEPGAAAACAATSRGHIGVIATEATIRGQAYQKAIGRILPKATVVAKACTLLVPLAEEGWIDGPIAENVAQKYLSEIFTGADDPDTLLLGCTHFPLFRNILQKLTGPAVRIVDSALATASLVREMLAQACLLNQSAAPGSRQFFTTDNRERFMATGGHFLGELMPDAGVRLINLQ